jgi:hypothetical protein
VSTNEEIMLPWVDVQKMGLAYVAQMQLWREYADEVGYEPELVDVMSEVIDLVLGFSPLAVSA